MSLGVLKEKEVKEEPVPIAMDLPELVPFSWGQGQGAVLNTLTKEKKAPSPVEHHPVFSWLGGKIS